MEKPRQMINLRRKEKMFKTTFVLYTLRCANIIYFLSILFIHLVIGEKRKRIRWKFNILERMFLNFRAFMLIFQKFHTISDNSKKYIFILNKIIDRKYFTRY